MKPFIAALLFLLIGEGVCKAGELLLLSKEEAMTRALERNLGIRREQSLVKISEEGVAFEKGAFDPELAAAFANTVEDNQNEDSLNVEIGGILPSGASYAVGVNSNEDLITDGRFSSFAGISFRQPLLQNFGLKPNLAGLRIARYQFDQSEWEFKQTLLDTLAETLFAFNDLYEAQKNLESSIRIRDLTNQTVLDNYKRVESGAMARLDIVEGRAQLASREERVLSARNSVIRAETRIKQLIFDNAKEALSFDLQAEDYAEPEVTEDFQTYLSTLLEQSPRFHVGEIALEIARLRLSRDKSQNLPSLDLIAKYGYSGLGGSLGGSIESALSDGDDVYTLGAAFRFPIPNRSARAQEAISEQRADIAEVDLESLEQAIQLEFYSSYKIMQTNYQRVDATRLARALAVQSLEAGEKKLNAGTSTTFIVLRLQSDLALAEQREISAIANYNRSVADFNRLRGVLE